MKENEDVLKGLSIEELEERAEFTAQELGWCEPCTLCACDM